jgi:hypothetical protein
MRIPLFTALVVLIVLALGQPASALVWRIETVDHPSNANVGDASSIALDSAGRPHIAYVDTIHSALKYARKKPDGTWQIETVDSPGFVAQGLSLALDASDGPHIAYYAGPGITSPANARYASRSCFFIWCSWNKETIATGVFSSSSAGNASLAFDPAGNPNVSYFDHTAGQLKWAEKVSGSWSSSNVVAARGGSASLALDADGFPHLAFSDSRVGTVNYVRVICIFILCGWNLEPVDPGTAGTLRLDAVGQPHLSYAQAETIKYAFGTCPASDPCAWAPRETVGVAGGIPRPPSLALDSCTVAHIAFARQRGVGVADLVYARRAGAATWNLETADLDASSNVLVSITVDTGNNPHISYQGVTLPGRALKYATGGLRAPPAARKRPPTITPVPSAPAAPGAAPRTRLEQPLEPATAGLVLADLAAECRAGR